MDKKRIFSSHTFVSLSFRSLILGSNCEDNDKKTKTNYEHQFITNRTWIQWFGLAETAIKYPRLPSLWRSGLTMIDVICVLQHNEEPCCALVCFETCIPSKRANNGVQVGRSLGFKTQPLTLPVHALSCLYSDMDGTWSTVVADILRESELIAVMTVHGCLSCHRCWFTFFPLSGLLYNHSVFLRRWSPRLVSNTVGSGPLGGTDSERQTAGGGWLLCDVFKLVENIHTV